MRILDLGRTTSSSQRTVAFTAAVLGIVLVAGAGPAWTQQQGVTAYTWGCVNESNGLSNNCTANDLTFVQLGLGIQRDGCVNSNDRVKIFLRGALQNTTAQARYDVGIFFPGDDGGIIDPEGDGALSGVCSVAGLMNPEPAPPTDRCVGDPLPAALDLNGGGGPFVNADGTGYYDRCGDIYANSSSTNCDYSPVDGRWDDTIVWIDLPADGIEITCNDNDGFGASDGFVDLPVCLTWGNNNTQVDANGDNLCDFNATLKELRPGTKSKCRCDQNQPTDIPAPELSVSCALPVDENGNQLATYDIRPGGSIRLAVTYNNACTCLPDTSTDERFRCCTASYVEFPISFDPSVGTVSADPYNPAPGSITIDNTAGTIVWRPESTANGLADGEGIVAQGESARLYFIFTVSDTASGTIDPGVAVASRWGNSIDAVSGALVNPVTQLALATDCNLQLNATWANVTGLTAEVRGGRTVVSWETSAEVGSVGYDVYRSEGPGRGWTKVNETLVPALGDGPGGRYELPDPSAPIEGTVTYKVRELDLRGRERETRPVSLVLHPSSEAPPSEGLVRQRREPSKRLDATAGNAGRHAAKSAGAHSAPPGGRLAPGQPRLVKIGVAETGLYRITAADIAAAWNEPLSKIATRISQHNLALTTGGQPVAWRADDGSEAIVFFGEAPDTIYDTERAYLLRLGRGLAIPDAGEAPAEVPNEIGNFRDTVAFEHDLLLRPFSVFEAGADFWFWDAVLADDPQYGERNLEIEIDGVAAPAGPARLELGFVSFGRAVNAEGSLYLNDHFVGTLGGPVPEHSEVSFDFDQSYLKNGTNTVRIIGHVGGMLLDRIRIAYERRLSASAGELMVHTPQSELVSVQGFVTSDIQVFDVTDPLQPARLPVATASYPGMIGVTAAFERTRADGSFLVVAGGAVRSPASIAGRPEPDLLGGTSGADYLIITTRDLAVAAARLAEHRRSDGLEAAVIDVEDIFDQFGFGARDPGALNAFLIAAANEWRRPPRYVLLAGRGHYDYKDLMGYGGNLLPPMLAASSSGVVPSDNAVADLDGDGVPDLAVGRLPVVSAAELNAAISKIVAYDGASAGAWSKQIVLAADNPDQGGDFVKSSNALALAAPAGRTVQKMYLFQPYAAAEMKSLLKNALAGGAGIVNWVGHAGLDSLADERVLTNADLGDLEHSAHPPLLSGLTCIVNNFGFPYFATLGEELSLLPGGGAIAVWAASGLSDNRSAEVLGASFLAALDSPQPERLGDTIVEALADYAGSRADKSLANEYVLFGDPAVVLK